MNEGAAMKDGVDIQALMAGIGAAAKAAIAGAMGRMGMDSEEDGEEAAGTLPRSLRPPGGAATP